MPPEHVRVIVDVLEDFIEDQEHALSAAYRIISALEGIKVSLVNTDTLEELTTL